MTGRSELDCEAAWQAYTRARNLCEISSGAALEEAQRAERDALWALVKCAASNSNEILLKLKALKEILGSIKGWRDGREKALLDSVMHDVAAVLRKSHL